MTRLGRDKPPKNAKKSAKNAKIHVADDKEFWILLNKKLREEVNEYLESKNAEELADVLQVIKDIDKFKKFKVETVRKKKYKAVGGFSKRIVME